jgi:hypothetical protein
MVNNRPLTYSRMHRFSIAAAILVALVLVACGSSGQPPVAQGGIPVQPGVATPTFIPTMSINEQQNFAATTQAINAAAQGTLQASIAQETRVAGQATAEAAAIATGTAQAVAAHQTATAEVIVATSAALEIRQTESAMVATSTAQAILNAQNAAAATQSAQLYTQQLNAAATQQAIDNQIRQAQAEREINRANLSRWTPGIIILAIVSIVSGVVLFIWWRDRSAVRIIQNIAIMRQPDGTLQPMLVGNHPGTPLLPAPSGDDVVDGEISEAKPDGNGNGQTILPASWDKFATWGDPRLIPIGCHALTRKPILVNRERKPHLMIAGSTGSGKSTFTVSYIAGYLATGAHVLIVNARGNDYSEFKGSPNVTMMPRVERHERPELLGSILGALLKEVDRRDKVLDRYGVSNWHQLPRIAGQPGEFMVVIDEFLALVNIVQRQDKKVGESMWYSLIDLTNEARKFGVYITLTVTDPTARALGDAGMQLRDQMGRVALSMGNAAASRVFLDAEKDDGWPKGSLGLPQGQFLGRVRHTLDHGVGFYPTKQQMSQYLSQHNPPVNDLPDNILRLTGSSQPQVSVATAWSDDAEALHSLFSGEQPKELPQVHPEALRILEMHRQGRSMRYIEAEVFGYTGGQAHQVVSEVISQSASWVA